MRIAIIAEVYLPKIDGVVIRTMNLIRHLQSQGDEILVVAPQAAGRGDSPVPVAEFRSFPFPAYPEYRIGLPDQRLAQTIQEFQPDLVHFLNPFAFGFQCFDILENAGLRIPTLFSFHTLYGEFVKRYALMTPLSQLLWWVMRDYHNRADRNLTVSSIMQHDLTERGFERVELWPPAVDCTLYNPHRACPVMRSHLTQGSPESPLLVTVSRLAPEKNVGFLADVMQRLPNVRLAIIGDGPDRAALERRFAGTNAAFFGYMKGTELATAYASADAFVYASETETMGNVVLEAMASGLGAVVPRAGGIPSLVADRQTGLLYAPRNPDDAVRAIRQLLDDSEFRQRTGVTARATVEQWGWDRSIQRVREHYLETIVEHRKRAQLARRKRKIGPAVVKGLVWAFRGAALGAKVRKQRSKVSQAVTPAVIGEPHLNPQGGIHGCRTESVGT
jgi:glycosyltransferase involved in cell wall biosynthesis